MNKVALIVLLFFVPFLAGAGTVQSDTIAIPGGQLVLHLFGHGSLMIEYNRQTIYIDPVSRYADYTTMPKADFILITHRHGDHYEKKSISDLSAEHTQLIISPDCPTDFEQALVMKNFDSLHFGTISIKAVPAYNLVHKRSNGEVFHPRGEGNGYLITLNGYTIYIAGDTENIPEMKDFGKIDIAFLPVNLPYTMDPDMFCDAVVKVEPKILYPYHTGKTDIDNLAKRLKQFPEIDVRIRDMQ